MSEIMDDSGLTEFLEDNDIDTEFVDDIPSITLTIEEVVNTFLEN